MRTKKTLLIMRLAVFLLVILTACQSSSSENKSVAAISPVGTWTVTIAPETGPAFVNALQFSGDGTLINMENTGKVGLGVWQELSGDTYAITFQEFFEDNGQFLHVKIRSTIQLRPDNEQFSGPYVVEVTDLNGNPLDTDKGIATGIKQHVEPMP